MRWSCIFKISLIYSGTFCITCKQLSNLFLLRAFMNEWNIAGCGGEPLYLPVLYLSTLLLLWICLVSLYLNPACWQTQQHYCSFPVEVSHEADRNVWLVVPNVSRMWARWAVGLDHAVDWCRAVLQEQLAKMWVVTHCIRTKGKASLWSYTMNIHIHYEYFLMSC